MAESTWDRDVRVMEVVRELERDHPPGGTRDQVAERADLDRNAANDALLGLIEGQHVRGRDGSTLAEGFDWYDLRLTERGRRILGAWPSDDPSDALMALVEERPAATDDPEEATKLRGLRDAKTDDERCDQSTNPWAVTSLVLGLLSIVLWQIGILPLTAVVVGVVALIVHDERSQSGLWMAYVGMVLGGIFGFMYLAAYGYISV